MLKFYLSLVAVFSVLSLASQQIQTPQSVKVLVTLPASKDNTIYDAPAGNSNALGGYFIAGVTSGGSVRRALIQFDLSSIPPGSTITNATLELTLNKTRAPSVAINLHKATADWGEGTSNAGSNPGGSDGSGTSATPGDATWNFRFHSTLGWGTAGGDFSPTITSTSNVNSPGVYSWSGAGMISDLQTWVNTPATNYGWVIKTSEVASSTAKRFVSRHTAAGAPVLTVEYTGPAPVTLSSLRASETDRGVSVNWTTQTELNNAFFLVEHSLDGLRFTNIGKVNGAGTTTSPRNYQLTHQGVLPGPHYYRLAQTDLNGRVEYSAVVNVNVRSKHQHLLISPNPVFKDLNIRGVGINNTMYYSIIGSAGSTVLSGKLTGTKIDVSNLAAGYYMLHITDGQEIMKSRFLVKRF